MPLPFIGAAAGAIGGLLQNRSNQNFSREMYQRQYDDNLTNWHRQNEYNHPAQQAERLEQAGLNKALMYGQGAGSGGNAASQSSGGNPQAVNQIDPISLGLSQLSAFQDLKMKKAQTDNIRADSTVKTTMLPHDSYLRSQQGAESLSRKKLVNRQASSEQVKARLFEEQIRGTKESTKYQKQINDWYDWSKFTNDPAIQKIGQMIMRGLSKK